MSHYSRNDRVIWQERRAIKKWAERNIKPSNNKGPTPKRSGKSKSNSHKRSKNERQAVQESLQTTADERAAGRFLDIHGTKACARLRPHQPVLSQYGTQ